jgi:hypothetical protein
MPPQRGILFYGRSAPIEIRASRFHLVATAAGSAGPAKPERIAAKPVGRTPSASFSFSILLQQLPAQFA